MRTRLDRFLNKYIEQYNNTIFKPNCITSDVFRRKLDLCQFSFSFLRDVTRVCNVSVK